MVEQKVRSENELGQSLKALLEAKLPDRPDLQEECLKRVIEGKGLWLSDWFATIRDVKMKAAGLDLASITSVELEIGNEPSDDNLDGQDEFEELCAPVESVISVIRFEKS